MRRPEGHPILAAGLDWMMRPLAPVRHRVIPLATGDVLEVGVGTGMNAPIYDWERVRTFIGIEPDPHMMRRARPRFAAHDAELVQCGAEAMPFEDASFDTVIVTFTLCTIPDVQDAIAEIRRVLRPDGVLHFAEHTASDHAPMRAVQQLLNAVWGCCAGGCHLDRDACALLKSGGFTIDSLHGHGRGPLNLTPVHRGVASRRGD